MSMEKNKGFEEKKRKHQRAEDDDEAAIFKRSKNNNAMVYVGNLSPETSVYELKCRFEGFGSISRAKIADKSGHGFVTFRSKEFAEAAIRAAIDPHGIIIRNKRVLVSWANDSLPPWKMGIEVSKLSKDVLSKKVPYKIPHGREGRGGNRAAVLAAATAAAGLRRGNTSADTVRHDREVVSYDDL
jgi:RNA recognition motif-containing protein